MENVNENSGFKVNDDGSVSRIKPNKSKNLSPYQSPDDNYNNNSNGSSGSGCGPIVILLVILGIIGGCAYGVYKASHDDDSDNDTNQIVITEIDSVEVTPTEENTMEVEECEEVKEAETEPYHPSHNESSNQPYEYQKSSSKTYINVTPKRVHFSWEGGQCEIKVFTNADWYMDLYDDSWMLADPYDDTIDVSVDPNYNDWKRSQILTIHAGDIVETILIVQDAY